MRISSWNWTTHPDPNLRTRGWLIGPFFGWMLEVYSPIEVKGFAVRLKSWGSRV